MGRLRTPVFRFARIFLVLLLYAIPAQDGLAQNGVEHIRDTGIDPELALEGNYVVRRSDGSEPARVSLVRSAVDLCGAETHRDHPRCSQILIPGPGGWVSDRDGWNVVSRASTSNLQVETEALSLTWDYARTSRLRAGREGSLAGFYGDPEDRLAERWERVAGRVTHVGFAGSEYGQRHFRLSPGDPTFPVSEQGRVEADYDSWWNAENSMRGNRPHVFLQLFGDRLWGLSYVELEGPDGLELAWPTFICRGETGERFTNSYWTSCDGGAGVIGLQITLVAWAGIQPGRYTIRVNGQPVVFDLIIHGWSGGSSAPDSLAFESPAGEPLEALGEGGAFRLVAHFETPPEADSVEAQIEGVQIGERGWDGSFVPVTLARAAEPNVYQSQSYFLTAPGNVQTARIRADSTRIEQAAIDQFFAGGWQVRHGPPLGSTGDVSTGQAEIDAAGGSLVLSLADPSGVQSRWRAYDFQPGYFPDDAVVSGLTARFVEDRVEFDGSGTSAMPVTETITARLNGTDASLRVSQEPESPVLSVRVTGRGAGTRMDGDWAEVSASGERRGGRAEWAKGGTAIHSVWVTTDQGAPGYSDHPFAPDAERAALRTRRLVLIGRNLPPVADGAGIESLDPGIRYAAQSPIYAVSPDYPGDPASTVPADRDAILSHIETLRGSTPEGGSQTPDLHELDFLVLTAELQPGVTPGMKALRVNGSEPASWQLAFADQHMQPALSRDGEEEHVVDAYPGETVFAEVRARANSGYETVEILLEQRRGEDVLAELPLTLRDLSVMRDDALDDSEGEDRDPEPVYRSEPVFLADPAGEAVPEEEIEPAAILAVEIGDELRIRPADPRAYSLAPRQAVTRIAAYPFDGQDYPLTDWEDALMQVARCLHRMPQHQARNFPEEAPEDFAAFSRYSVLVASSTSYASSFIETFDHPGSAVWVYKQAYQAVNGRPFDLSNPPDTVTVTTSEWAAALLYAGAVARQMQGTAAEMAELASDARAMFALRDAARAGRAGPLSAFWNTARIDIPLSGRTQAPGEASDVAAAGALAYGTLWLWDVYASDEAPLAATLDTAALARMTGWSEPAAERWAVEQTQSALQNQVRETREAIERVRASMDGCDYLELMKVARYRIDPIMETIYPRLVVRERHDDGTWTMRTDRLAQMDLRNLPMTAAVATAFEEFASADDAVFQLAVSAVFIPFGASHQAARIAQAGYDAYSLAGDVADIYQSEQDYAYASGLSVALGDQVVADAEARRAGAFDIAMLGLGAGGLGSDLAGLRRGMSGARAAEAFPGTTGTGTTGTGTTGTGTTGPRAVAEARPHGLLDDDPEFDRLPFTEAPPSAIDDSTRRFDQSEVEQLGRPLMPDGWIDPEDLTATRRLDAAETPTMRTGEFDPDATLRTDAPTQVFDAEDLTATRRLDAAETLTMRTGELDPDATLRTDAPTQVLDAEDLTRTRPENPATSRSATPSLDMTDIENARDELIESRPGRGQTQTADAQRDGVRTATQAAPPTAAPLPADHGRILANRLISASTIRHDAAGNPLPDAQGDEIVIQLGEHLGSGSFNDTFYTNQSFFGRNPDDTLIRISKPVAVGDEGAALARTMDTLGRRILTEMSDEIIAPSVLGRFLIRDGAGQARMVEVVERIEQSAAIVAGQRRFSAVEAAAYDRVLRTLNRRGLVALDLHEGNFSFVRDDATGQLRVAIIDPGGIIPLRGRDPAAARELQAMILNPPDDVRAGLARRSLAARAQYEEQVLSRIEPYIDADALGFELHHVSFDSTLGARREELGALFASDDPEQAYRAMLEAEAGGD